MPRHCSAGGCKSRDNRETRNAGITFHKLPKGTTRRNLWITNSHRTDLWDPQTDFVYFCSKHFTPESFELTGCSGIRRLREDALPTVFESSSETKRKGPRRPQNQDNIYVRKNLQSLKSESDHQGSIQKETKEDQNKDEVENEGKCGSDRETSLNIPASSEVTGVEKLSQQECSSSSPLVCRPHSPSRYMRRLPPPPGFYVPKEHSYAQLCPLLWRRRYDQAIDCLEKAVRQLHAARRRENRLRSTLMRLREKRLKHALLFSQDGSKSRGGMMPGENRQCRGSGDKTARGSCFPNQEESEIDVKCEDIGIFEDRSGEQMEWDGRSLTADINAWSEEEGGYCFYCGRGRERDGSRVACRVSKTRKHGQPVVRDGSLRSHATKRSDQCGKWLQLLKRVKGHKKAVMNIEEGTSQESGAKHHDLSGLAESAADLQIALGKGVETTLNLNSGSNLPIPQVLLQTQGQGGLQQMTPAGLSLHDTYVQCPQSGQGSQQPLILSDLCVGEAKHIGQEHREELKQQLFWIQDSAEGQVLLVSVHSQDGPKSVVRMEGAAEDAQTILASEVDFKRNCRPMTEDNVDKCIQNLSRELRFEIISDNEHGEQHSNVNNTSVGIREDVRERLKEHLEGFHLQLSTEFIK